ncbi:hypothetical protein [Mangrovibrevibacter kandeliae]|uniref:hypothetical protein n=1 Tax=Mangrovibrevibacter kandeliae TaxID=2968473 RepID=UPI0021193197|nr:MULTISPECIES: hypothetical protein [unclassified Aurantimonas]MCQ8781468.1 hypothetical protein [Aurantimonas sp. CSK15Z-1]MCW4114247.1 hypothetical protein [Aurantimonas sp. MSK8Z-1]
MARELPEQREFDMGRGTATRGNSELDPSDIELVEVELRDDMRDPADREPGTLADDDALYVDVSAEPASEVTGTLPMTDDAETEDGLDDLEEVVREEAEERPLGGRGGFNG